MSLPKLLTILSIFIWSQAIGSSNKFVIMSQDFLTKIKDKQSVDNLIIDFKNIDKEELSKTLSTNEQRLAFWINIYNGFIQVKLGANPEYYENRRNFFSKKFIEIAGFKLSFADIEHGIVRKSQYEYFLGFITKPFPPGYEKLFRVFKRDPRIHFALNCGAKSCPPVGIYDDSLLDDQFTNMTQKYLKEFSHYDEESKTFYTVALFSWFRGDFGGGKGIRKFLVEYDVLDFEPEFVKITEYDWTLDLGNFEDASKTLRLQ